MGAQLKWIQTCSCSRMAHHLTLPETPSATCRVKSVASKQSKLEPGRLCSVGTSAAARVLRWQFETLEQPIQVIVSEWCALSEKFTDRIINEWRRRLKCVVQQNNRHIKHLFKQLFSSRLYTAFLLQFMHICELYSFIDLLCKIGFEDPHLHACCCCSMWRHLP